MRGLSGQPTGTVEFVNCYARGGEVLFAKHLQMVLALTFLACFTRCATHEPSPKDIEGPPSMSSSVEKAPVRNRKAQIYFSDKAFGGEDATNIIHDFYEVIRHEMIHAVGAPNRPPTWAQILKSRNWRDLRNDLAGHPYYRTIMAVCH